MKKFILTAIAVLGIALGANAQGSNFGIKGGVNLATLTGDDVESVEARTSFHVGGAFEIGISGSFAFQPEFLYSSQGIKAEGDGVGELKLDYINIPLMAKLYVAEGLNIQAGPQIGFLTAAKLEGQLLGVEVSGDVSDLYEKVDMGVNLGLGYKFSFGLFFDARYNIGLSTIDDVTEADIKNSVMQFSLGFFF